jgi:pyrimidine operon attenuation protein / uracil phosphoribosyltransferase
MPDKTVILNELAIHRVLTRIAHEIAERNDEGASVVVIGVQSGGIFLARRIAAVLKNIWGTPVPVGSLDVAMHRDDLNHKAAPKVYPTDIPFDINDKLVVLVDDVLFRGRTVRAALDALTDLGRPRKVQLAVLVDRGHRELPIKADFVGKNVPTALTERVEVKLKEDGGEDVVYLEKH